MDTILALKALIMGIVEGLTEFLPISSTGHLILANSLLQFTGPSFSKEKADVFEIVIQAGAILAVCWEYRVRIATVLSGMFTDRKAQRLVINLIIAFLPAAILGFLFSRRIKEVLFNPVSVAIAFIVGGLIILAVESRKQRQPRIHHIDELTALDALKVGLCQCFGMIPGTSRSGSTIIGGLLVGLSRPVATEFSFFLAIPTMIGATTLEFAKHHHDIMAGAHGVGFGAIAVGLVVSFVVALVVVRAFVHYISRHGFAPFAWYRIVAGAVALIWLLQR